MKRDPHKTQEWILAAATKQFAASGIAGARVDEIAADSGVNKRMIYHYFGDKQGLYERVLAEQMLQMYGNIRVPQGDSPDERIRSAIEAYLDYCHHHSDYISLMLWEMVSGWETLNRISDQLEDKLHSYLLDTIEEGVAIGKFHSETNPRLFMSLATVQIFCFFPMLKHPHLMHKGRGIELQDHEIDHYKKLMVDQLMRSLEPVPSNDAAGEREEP